MADPRSVMQEFRFLEQKRQSGSLTPDEVARHAELRDLVGFEQPLPARGGFDVAAAAAQLRESLLPAGLRNRSLDAPPPPPAASTFPAPAEAAPPPAPAPPAAETYFNPASLGQEARPQAWNPDAPGYDPDAPYDEAAWIAAGYDPNVTYDWSAVAAPEGAIAEPAPLQFGEYDAAGPPVAPAEPGAPTEPLPAAPREAGAWFDDAGVAAAAPPPTTLAFGEYDAPPPLELGEPSQPLPGVTDDPSLPGGAPLELSGAPTGWLSDGAPDGGFELASDGSFGQPAPPPQPVPWSGPGSPAAAERWESAPALDLSTPFEPFPLASAPPAAPLQVPEEPPEQLEPEELLEPLLELIPEPAASLDPGPDERAWAPQVVDTGAPTTGSSAGIGEPRGLGEVDSSFEIDVPTEITAAFESPHPPPAFLDFDSPAPGPLPVAAEPAPVVVASPEPTVQARPSPEIEPVPAPTPAPSGGGTVVAGLHRVVVHTLDGAVLRGLLRDSNLEAPVLELDTGMPGTPTAVGTDTVKAIFFMLASGDPPPEPHGKRVRVAFRDGRQVAGFSPDYREGGVGFFMIPVDTRTNTGRIWVYQAAVKQVTVS